MSPPASMLASRLPLRSYCNSTRPRVLLSSLIATWTPTLTFLPRDRTMLNDMPPPLLRASIFPFFLIFKLGYLRIRQR
jgi:hypothetical protein